MVFFAGRRPTEDTEAPPRPSNLNGQDFGMPNEANPGTFYSAMSNIDLEIGEGNPAAVGVRGRYAQHCYLAHMEFRLAKDALAGIHDTGNFAEDLHFHGGQYGIITRTPSPGWQFTLMDSSFENQTKTAIRTHETGLTLVRPAFKGVPTAIEIDPDHTEQLWMKDARMEEIDGPAIVISREKSLRLQINIDNVVCRRVPVFAKFRESGKQIAGKGDSYEVAEFSHGLHYDDLGSPGKVETRFKTGATSVPSVPSLPSSDTWVNLRSLGAKGDGTADDTAVLKEAIERHRSIYLPQGRYRVTDTILLKPDTVLIGLNPITTQIVIVDGTPAFLGVPESQNGRRGPGIRFPGEPVALLETPKGGTNIVTGIGLDTGGNNPAAVGALWKAGEMSMMDDVKFLGGHGSGVAQIYDNDHTADPNPERRWDSQYPSLWVTDQGGGTFKNIWTASPYAQAGMLVSDTQTKGQVYEMSSEHHVRYEVQVHNAKNWSFIALQTEEERGEGPFALPLEITDSSDITIANLNMYRVVSLWQPFPYAVKVSNSENIRFRGFHCYSNSKVSFDNAIYDSIYGTELRQREFASMDLSGKAPKLPAKIHEVDKLASGFFNISGGAVNALGDFCFVDARWHRIYRWISAEKRLETIADAPLYPTNLIFDKSNNLMVVSYAGKGTVYAYRHGVERITVLSPEGSAGFSPHPGGQTSVWPGGIKVSYAFPVTDWGIPGSIVKGEPFRRPFHFASPDGTVVVPVGEDFLAGTLSWGTKLQDVIRTFGLAKAIPGKPFYVTGESDCRTYRVDVEPDGTMTNGKLFAEQGGESVSVDDQGNVYIAAGQVYVYNPSGKLIDTIAVPERPIQLAFGGPDGKTLFIAARTSLYAVKRR